MRVPLFDMVAEVAAIRAELDAAIARVIDRGAFIGGPEVEAFEAELARAAPRAARATPAAEAPMHAVGVSSGAEAPMHAVGVSSGAEAPMHAVGVGSGAEAPMHAVGVGSGAEAPMHAVGVSSGTDALLAVLLALGIGAGDEVVTTPLTFFATASAAARLGARVVFADVDDDKLTLPVRAAVTACTPTTRAIVTVHLYGHPAPVPTRGARGEHGEHGDRVAWVEDAAHSALSVPLTGDAAALSFFPTKNLGALGDAGAVLTHRADLAQRVRLLRSHGASPKYHHVAIGGNFRLDALQAAVLRAKLAHLSAWTAARRAHAARYRECFAAAGATIPPELRLPADHASHAYHQFCIRAPRRDELRAFLADAGIGTEVYYPEPLHLQPCWGAVVREPYRPGSLPIAERACRELLALPIHPTLAAGSEAYVVEKIAQFYRQ